jgi:hypothetical protein
MLASLCGRGGVTNEQLESERHRDEAARAEPKVSHKHDASCGGNCPPPPPKPPTDFETKLREIVPPTVRAYGVDLHALLRAAARLAYKDAAEVAIRLAGGDVGPLGPIGVGKLVDIIRARASELP